jgi:hypothetical protein
MSDATTEPHGNEPHGNKNDAIGYVFCKGMADRQEFLEADRRSGLEIAKAWLAVFDSEPKRLTSQPNQAEYENYAAAAKSIGQTPVSKHRLKSFSVAAINALIEATENAVILKKHADTSVKDANKFQEHAARIAAAMRARDYRYFVNLQSADEANAG